MRASVWANVGMEREKEDGRKVVVRMLWYISLNSKAVVTNLYTHLFYLQYPFYVCEVHVFTYQSEGLIQIIH